MTTFQRLADLEDHFDFDLATEINEPEAIVEPAKAKVLSYRKSKGNLVNNNSTPHLPPSPAESMMTEEQLQVQPHMDVTDLERDRLTNFIDRDTPGATAAGKTPEQKNLNRRRSQFYQDAFAWREPISSARERVTKESIVMADVKTNVIINDEYTFITDLSYNLSSRYQRPESSILVTVHHSACLLFASSFEPAYTLTITALPSLVQPMTNRRNTTLLQKSLEEALGVPASRGVIRYLAMPEENFAFNGQTYAGEIDDLEQRTSQESGLQPGCRNGNLSSRPGSKNGPKMSKKRNSLRSLKNMRAAFGGGSADKENVTPPASMRGLESPGANIPIPPVPAATETDKRAGKVQALPRRKSFLSLFSSKKDSR